MSRKEEVLPATIVRNLSDKLYEKRKLGATDLEQLVKHLKYDKSKIKEIIRILQTDFLVSTNVNIRKGGLIGLAGVALGLGEEANTFGTDIFPALLSCFDDPDSKVRYGALEATYNICTIPGGKCLEYFRDIFDGLCKLACDPDKEVRDGARLLDNLLKDTVSATHMLDVKLFIQLIKERILVTNTETRKFLVGWIILLQSVPDIDIVEQYPEFLDGLFKMLSDKSDDLREVVKTCLAELLDATKRSAKDWEDYKRDFILKQSALERTPTGDQIAQSTPQIPDLIKDPSISELRVVSAPTLPHTSSSDQPNSDPTELQITPPKVYFRSIVTILIKHAEGAVELISPTALQWLHDFIVFGKEAILSQAPQILGVVLRLCSNPVRPIETQARRVNKIMQTLITNTEVKFDITDWITTLTDLLVNQPKMTKVGTLRWFIIFNNKGYLKNVPGISNNKALLSVLSDGEEDVVIQALHVLADLCADDENQFFDLMSNLVKMFREHKNAQRVELIIKELCSHIKPEKIYRVAATILESEQPTEFAFSIIQILNSILLTSTELSPVRDILKELSNENSRDFFITLYKSWCHNEVAAFSLCLLSQAYVHATNLILKFSEFEVTINTLTEIDKLVYLIESPIFLHLRLQLMEPDKYRFLFKALYGILMLLPQGPAFEVLRNRLNSVTCMGEILLIPQSDSVVLQRNDIDWIDLLNHFVLVRKNHQARILQNRVAEEKRARKLQHQQAQITSPKKEEKDLSDY